MKFIGIHKKLTLLARKVLIGTTGAFAIAALLLGTIFTLNTFRDIKENTERDLISKGKLLTSNNSMAIGGMAEDYAFLAVKELVASTVARDKDVIYGIYMDKDRQPWVMSTAQNPGGNVTGQSYLNDSTSLWASSLSAPGYIGIQTDSTEVLEFAAPVISEDKMLGTIRYGITTHAMIQAVDHSKKSYLKSVISFSGVLLIISVLVYLFVSGMAGKQAASITKPLDELTELADEISKGNYTNKVDVVSNDEIGDLARNFETMRTTIKNYTDDLESMVILRTKELEQTQKELVDKAHKAGMADIATAVLHDVGNILTSVVVSGNLIKEKAKNSIISKFIQANSILRDKFDNLEEFILKNPKGKKLLEYYLTLDPLVQEENLNLIKQSDRLTSKIDAIREVIASQQSFASEGSMDEILSPSSVVNDAINIQLSSLQGANIELVRDYEDVPDINMQKIKLVHIIINLLKNAKESLMNMDPEKRKIIVRIKEIDDRVCIQVADKGLGIKAEDKAKVFSHGFTTKTGGHGFGLHSSANYMTEMGGSLQVESEGQGKGASFSMYFPIPEKPGVPPK